MQHDDRAQTFVASHNGVDRAAQRAYVELTFEQKPQLHVILRAAAIELVDEPYPLLHEGHGHLGTVRRTTQRRWRAFAALRDQPGKVFERCSGEEVLRMHYDVELLAHAAEQPHRQNRMASEVEEIRLHADGRRQLQHVLP